MSNGQKLANADRSAAPVSNMKKPPAIMISRGESGILQWFSFQKGFGFIKVNSTGKDLFVHRNEFLRESLQEVFYLVYRGYKLEFDIIRRSRGFEAVAVTGADGQKIAGSLVNGTRNRDRNFKETAQKETERTNKTEEKPKEKKVRRGNRKKRSSKLEKDVSKEEKKTDEDKDPVQEAFFEKVRRSIQTGDVQPGKSSTVGDQGDVVRAKKNRKQRKRTKPSTSEESGKEKIKNDELIDKKN